MGPLYLFDTTIILELVRGKARGLEIESTCGLRNLQQRPLICEVTIAELEVLATRNGWGSRRRLLLADAVGNLVRVNISAGAIHNAYHDIDLLSQRHPKGSRNMGKNDLWIAACAKATGAHLLTADKDFDHLFEASAIEGTKVV